jgi:hypothetical protein
LLFSAASLYSPCLDGLNTRNSYRTIIGTQYRSGGSIESCGVLT